MLCLIWGFRPGPSFPAIWPLPAEFRNGTATVMLSPTFKLAPDPAATLPRDCPAQRLLARAIQRYHHLALARAGAPHAAHPGPDDDADDTGGGGGGGGGEDGPRLTELLVKVGDSDAEGSAGLATDESYTLHIPADGTAANLRAATVVGAMRGLETFAQLVQRCYDSEGLRCGGRNTFSVQSAPWSIRDRPRFQHRGMHGFPPWAD